MFLPAIKVVLVTLVALGSTLVVSPSHIQPFLAVKPVEVQRFSDLSEPNDIQPAYGYKVLQDTANPQPNVGFGNRLQPAATTNLYQQTDNVQQQ